MLLAVLPRRCCHGWERLHAVVRTRPVLCASTPFVLHAEERRLGGVDPSLAPLNIFGRLLEKSVAFRGGGAARANCSSVKIPLSTKCARNERWDIVLRHAPCKSLAHLPRPAMRGAKVLLSLRRRYLDFCRANTLAVRGCGQQLPHHATNVWRAHLTTRKGLNLRRLGAPLPSGVGGVVEGGRVHRGVFQNIC